MVFVIICRDGVLGHQFEKRLDSLLHAIPSLSTVRFLIKNRLYFGFKNTSKKIGRKRKT
jgi:hypothetical protein